MHRVEIVPYADVVDGWVARCLDCDWQIQHGLREDATRDAEAHQGEDDARIPG